MAAVVPHLFVAWLHRPHLLLLPMAHVMLGQAVAQPCCRGAAHRCAVLLVLGPVLMPGRGDADIRAWQLLPTLGTPGRDKSCSFDHYGCSAAPCAVSCDQELCYSAPVIRSCATARTQPGLLVARGCRHEAPHAEQSVLLPEAPAEWGDRGLIQAAPAARR
jgi:hypothetical protein